jgi:predicted O-methyltransferase YrrM
MASRNQTFDPFKSVRDETLTHLRKHGCGCYPFFDGSLLGAIAATAQAKRILELGTALGYTALWFAQGAPDAQIDTIEIDPEHMQIARKNIAAAGFASRITVHLGRFEQVMPKLTPGYDIGFFDGFDPTLDDLANFRRLLRPRGVLITTNLDMGGRDTARYRQEISEPSRWLTTFAAEDKRTAVSIML